MGKIFIGMFFILLDLNVKVPSAYEGMYYIIGLLPSFVGYLLIALGLKQFSGRNKFFDISGKVSWIMFALTLLSYGLNATGFVYSAMMLSFILGLLIVAGTILVPFIIIKGAQAEERKTGVFWNTRMMLNFWLFYTIFTVLQNVIVFVPSTQLYFLVTIGLLVTVIGLIFAFGKVRNNK